jgi:methylmalonyl-CoA/ethylmalonyl-CoA epimerase
VNTNRPFGAESIGEKMAKVTKINHVGIAVANVDEALKFWRDILGIELDHVEDVPSSKSKVAFLPVGDSDVELVYPASEDAPINKFIAERGGGIHHLCIEVDDISAMLTNLKEKGVRLIDEEPKVMPGRKMAFIHPKSTGGVLLELYEVTK